MKKIFSLCVILMMLSGCSEFALLASGTGFAVSQNSYAKMYNSIDFLTTIKTKKDIKTHVYEKGKKYIYDKSFGLVNKH